MKPADTLLLCFFGIFLLLHGTGGTPQDGVPIEGSRNTIKRCEDIPANAELDGQLFVDGHIDCPSNNRRWIRVKGDSVVRTKNLEDMRMTNVAFVVDPGVYVAFMAPTIVLDRTKTWPVMPLIQTEGIVDFWANSWDASSAGKSPTDSNGLVLELNKGYIFSMQNVLFSENAIHVVDSTAASKNGNADTPPRELPSSPFSLTEQPETEGGSPGSTKNGDGMNDGGKSTPVATEQPYLESDDPHDKNAASADGNMDLLHPASADAASAAPEDVNNRAGQTDTDDQTTSGKTGIEEVGTTAPANPVSDFDAQFSASLEAIAAAYHAAAAAAAATADAVASSATNGGGGGVGDAPREIDEEGIAELLAHSQAGSSAPSDREQVAAAILTEETSNGIEDVGQPHGVAVGAKDISGTVISNGVRDSATQGAAGAGAGAAGAGAGAAGAGAGAAVGSTSGVDDAAAEADAGAAATEAREEVNKDIAGTSSPNSGTIAPEETQQANTAVHSSDRSSSSSSSSTGDLSAASAKSQVFPWPVLKANERHHGGLPNGKRTAETYARPSDASVMWASWTGDVNGRLVESGPEEVALLVQSDRRKAAKAFERRADIDAEEKEEARIAAAGGRSKGRRAAKVLRGWVPIGKNGWPETRRRKHAKAHLGEVEMHITARGNLEASMDGTVVLSKAGPSWFGYRRKDSSYEYRTVDKGFEVMRRGKFDWGVTADDD